MCKININIFILFITSILYTSCGKYLDQVISNDNQIITRYIDTDPNEDIGLYYNFITNDEIESINVFSKDKPKVFLISSLGCTSCIDEHQLIEQKIQNNTINLTNFHLYSLILGYDPLLQGEKIEIQNFQLQTQSNWPMGGDPENYFMKNFCDDFITPCTLIFDKNNNLLFSKIGEVDLANELEKLGIN